MGILTEDIRAFVGRQKLGFVATVCPDGTPNLSPKGTTAVWDNDHLVFADIHSPGTVSNLLVNPSIEINMVDVFARKGYRFKGTARIVSREPLFDKMLAFYGEAAEKYSIKHFVLVKVDQVLPMASPVYDTGATQTEVVTRWIGYWKRVYPDPV